MAYDYDKAADDAYVDYQREFNAATNTQRPGDTPEQTAARLRRDNPAFRVFASGATRDSDENKLDFEGLLSPLVLEEFAKYMHGKRKMPDGTMRDSDNWQKG